MPNGQMSFDLALHAHVPDPRGYRRAISPTCWMLYTSIRLILSHVTFYYPDSGALCK